MQRVWLTRGCAGLHAGHVKANKDDIDAALDELAALAEEHGLSQESLCKGYELALGGVLRALLSLVPPLGRSTLTALVLAFACF